METVQVIYKGERGSLIKYRLSPGGQTYSAHGYVFGAGRRTNAMSRDEAELLTQPSANSGVKKVVGGKEVSVKNRELVTVGNNGTLTDDDIFEIVGDAVKPAAAAKKTEAKE